VFFGIVNVLVPLLTVGVLIVFKPSLIIDENQKGPLLAIEAVRQTYNLFTGSLVGCGFLMFDSGCTLLLSRGMALIWANLYALVSILTKAGYLCMEILVVIPARTATAEQVIASGGKLASSGSHLFAAILMAGIPAIYPLVLMLVLNRAKVKNWLAWRAHVRRYGIA
jgi:hypothetical protein